MIDDNPCNKLDNNIPLPAGVQGHGYTSYLGSVRLISMCGGSSVALSHVIGVIENRARSDGKWWAVLQTP